MKRFTSTDKWDDSWHCSLSPAFKLAWAFLNDKCDHAGVFDMPSHLVAAYIGDSAFTVESFAEAAGEDRIKKLPCGKWWLPKYISFQNSNGISTEKRPHQPILKSISKYHLPVLVTNDPEGIFEAHNQWVLEGYPIGKLYPTDTSFLGKSYVKFTKQGTDKDKDKDKSRKKRGVGKGKEGKGSSMEPFEVFWEIMPTKTGKGAAKKAFEKAAQSHDPWMIVRKTAVYCAAEQARYRAHPDDYSPLHPATWLNQERFLDEPSSIPQPPKKVVQAAWTASGRNGAGPPEWKLLTKDVKAIDEMTTAYAPFRFVVEGIKECVQIVSSSR